MLGTAVSKIYGGLMKKSKVVVVLTAVCAVNVFFFQNCAKTTSFSAVPLDQVSIDGGGVRGPASVEPAPRVCTKTDEYLNPATNACEVFKCSSYEEISGNSIVVPARDITTGKCYYSKIQPKYSNTLQTSVLARNHGRSSGTGTNLPPMIIGSKSFDVLLQGDRAVKLSASPTDISAPILVDNFILVRMNNDSFMRAYGTADSTIKLEDGSVTDYFLYKNIQVPFKAYEAGGTARISELNITGALPVGVQSNISVEALDCGAAQEIVPMYVVFQ